MTRIYPNGKADVNHFHAAGGMGLLIRELVGAGLLHADARTVWGERLGDYAVEPHLDAAGDVLWRPARRDVGRRERAARRRRAVPADRGVARPSTGRSGGRSSRPRPSRPTAT